MSSFLADELLEDLNDENQSNIQNDSLQNDIKTDEEGWGVMQDDEGMIDSIEDDLAGLDDDDDNDNTKNSVQDSENASYLQNPNAIRPAEEMQAEDVENVKSVYAICPLMRSQRMADTMAKIRQFSSLTKPDVEGVLEDSPEYKLIVHANNLAVEVDNELLIAHKFIRQNYKPRFPELESLITNPREFVQAIRAIGNHDNIANAKLNGILPHGTVVVISMQASTTKGRRLDAEAWKNVEQACDLVSDLDKTRTLILDYVQSRMNIIAPNLSKVVGSQVATKLLGIAGGLTSLIKIPACNLMLLGSMGKQASGLSSTFSGRRNGFILQSPLIQAIPQEYHRQALRIVSAKALLAARVDAGRSDLHGSYGTRLMIELEKKLEKLQEPPPAKMIKALPVPKEGGKKARRGGRKARKFKERNGMSEVRKAQNRVQFGEAEEETGAFDESEGMGMLNSKGDGQVRAQVANKNTEARMSKRNIERIRALRQSANSSNRNDDTSGTATTLTFTPVQGIELSDPSRQKKVEEANAKWFKEGSFSLARYC
ncbi:Nop domain-containing protein [Meira miltonrushii]|uniref:Nop domain-containing protein n=1 Tax=Meira miltonrushii TaxID=1280837 RepID=A0A316V795_9BASI|nr:Nop domain-containing protein [Meira miltonrushii]PWN31345.1 Nop domain-containing protein [Meira miltonrushii]